MVKVLNSQDSFSGNAKIAERLKRARKRKGLNQADFAALGGVSLHTQHRYEGGVVPSLEYLLELGRKGIDWHWIATGETRARDSLDEEAATALSLFLELEDDLRKVIVSHLRALRDATAVSKPARDRPAVASDRVPQASATLHSPKRDYRGKN